MKRGKQVLAILLAILCLVATLAGCGNKSGEAQQNSSSESHKNPKALKRSDFALVDKNGTPVYISLYDHKITGTKPGKDQKGFTTIHNLTDLTNSSELYNQGTEDTITFSPQGMCCLQLTETTKAAHQWESDYPSADYPDAGRHVNSNVFLKLRKGVYFGCSQAAVKQAYGVGEDKYNLPTEEYEVSFPYSQKALKSLDRTWNGNTLRNLYFDLMFSFDENDKLSEIDVTMIGVES